ncbi:MAG: hypothetical protein LBQ48_03495 [Oscillospiraceae bacterium]|jgi:hypothetical protein|nr:hypothetical protein [Oscillospiraceae bacterium]
MEIKISEKGKPIQELLTEIYSEEQLNEINDLKSSLKELNSQYPIQCLREVTGGYRAAYRSTNSILLTFFDGNKQKLFSQKQTLLKKKADFESIKVGQTLDEIRDFDETGDYIFLYTGRVDTPKISSHYTVDGCLFKISYDDDLKVISIESELI